MSDPELLPTEPRPNAHTVIPLRAAALMAFLNLLWAASNVASTAALQSFPPFTLTVMRFIPAGLFLLWFVHRRSGLPRIERADVPHFFALGLVGITLTYAVFYSGLMRTRASDASLLMACEPILVALCARIFLKERLNSRQWGGMLLGLLGVYLIAGNAWGSWIVLLGLCFESGVSVIAKRLTDKYSGLFVVAVEFLIGAGLLLPFALWEWSHAAHAITWQAVAGWFYLCAGCSAFCYGMWFRLMEQYPVSAMGVLLLIQPMTGPVFAWLLKGEQLTSKSIFGGAMVVTGILITTLRRPRPQ